jgi:7-cyano-7-deazaguanine synthase
MKNVVLSLSGGMDSTCLLIHLLQRGFDVKCYSFDYGQKHRIELERVQKNIQYLQEEKCLSVSWEIIDIKSVFSESNSALLPQSGVNVPEGNYTGENMKATVVENRNGIFSSIIYGKALAWANRIEDNVLISLGIHSGDHEIYLDCRPESRDAFAHAFKISNLGSERVSYYTPYLSGNKFSILEEALFDCEALDLNFDKILSNTNTCYNPNEKGESCGKCGSCIERVEAFDQLGIKDPVNYIDTWGNIVKHMKIVLKK